MVSLATTLKTALTVAADKHAIIPCKCQTLVTAAFQSMQVKVIADENFKICMYTVTQLQSKKLDFKT